MVVNLHVDLETLQLIQGPGQRSAVSSLRFKRGDAARLRVVFLESGITPVTIGTPSGLEIQIGVKPRNQFDHSYLAQSTNWTMPVAGDETPTYECTLSLNTLQLNTALNIGSATAEELPEITLMGEITFREGTGEPTSTRTFMVVVENDVNRGTEGIPNDATPPFPPELALKSDLGTSATANTGTTEGTIPLLGAGGKLASSLLPSISITETLAVANATARLALPLAQAQGKIVIEADTGRSFGLITGGTPAASGDWLQVGDRDITASDISDFSAAVASTASVAANTAKISNATHTGDVTGSSALTIANDAVTNAKLANMATATIKGRVTAGTGDPEDLTVGNGLEFSGSGIRRSALTGDITAAAGSNSTTLASTIAGSKTFSGGVSFTGITAITTGAVSTTPFRVNITDAASFPRRVIEFNNLDLEERAYLKVDQFTNGTTWTLGAGGGTLATLDGVQTLTNKTIDAPTITNAAQFTSTTRPTSAGTGTPAATSLITAADGDLRYQAIGTVPTHTHTFGTTAGTFAQGNHTHTFGTTAGTFAQGNDSRLTTVTAATPFSTPNTLVKRDSYGGGVYFTSSDTESTTVSITNSGTTDNTNPVALNVEATGGGAVVGVRIRSTNNTALDVRSTSASPCASITSDSGENHATFGVSGINRSFVARVAGAFGWFRGSATARIQAADTLTGNRIYTLPDASGTVALNGLLLAPGPYADDMEAAVAGVPDNGIYSQPSGAVAANINHLSLDLAFALNKTLKARRGPTPTFVRASTATYVGPNEVNANFLFDSIRYIVDVSQLTTGQAVLNGRYRWQNGDTSITYNGTAWTLSQDGITVATSASTSDAWRPDLADWSGTLAAITPRNTFGIVRAAISEPRFDYDPVTGICRGLLVEEQRTNALLNSDTLVTRSVTVTAVARTLSFYGTGTVVLSGAHSATVVGTGAFPARTTLTFTPTAGTLTLTVTGTVRFAQLEIGTNASSYIPTTTVALTRSSDLCSITGAAFAGMYNDLAGTIFCEHTLNAIGGVTTPNTAWIGSQQNGISMQEYGGSPSLWGIITTDESTQFSSDLGNLAFGVSRKSTMAFQHGGSAILCQNGTLGTQDNSVALPSDSLGGQSPTQMFLFQGQFVTIKSFRYFKTRLSNAKLQTLTTL